MKRVLFIVFAAFVICSIQTKGQIGKIDPYNGDIAYSYDAAGNRIKKYVATIAIPNNKSTELEDDEEFEEQFFKNDFGMREIIVYPNPVKIDLTIEIWKGNEKEQYSYLLYDMTGKLLIERRREGNGSVTIDLSAYPSGIYVLIINTGEERLDYKIIKE
jgi:hypothetical protein